MMPDRASWCLMPRPHSAPLQTGSATPNYEGTRTPEVHAAGAWTWAISTYSCVLSSAEWKPPLVLPVETHFQIPSVMLATRDWRRAFGPARHTQEKLHRPSEQRQGCSGRYMPA